MIVFILSMNEVTMPRMAKVRHEDAVRREKEGRSPPSLTFTAAGQHVVGE